MSPHQRTLTTDDRNLLRKAFAAGYLAGEAGEHSREVAWAIWFPTRNNRHALIVESILRAIPRGSEVCAGTLLAAIRDDYGAVPDRTVYRYIRTLIKMKFLIRHGPMHASTYSCGSPRFTW